MDLLNAVGLPQQIGHFYGNWREEQYRNPDGSLRPYASIAWQIESKWDPRIRQVYADKVIKDMFADPYQLRAPHWEVLLTNCDMTMADTNFVIGGALPDLGTVTSLARLEQVQDHNLRRECIRTQIFHEIGHVFNLPDPDREHAVEYLLGKHCARRGCSMKQGLNVPRDWELTTRERLAAGGRPYCDDCTHYLLIKYRRQE